MRRRARRQHDDLGIGSLLRLVQVGNLQAYAFLFGLGIVGLIYFTVFRMILLFVVLFPIAAALAILARRTGAKDRALERGLTLVATSSLFQRFRSRPARIPNS